MLCKDTELERGKKSAIFTEPFPRTIKSKQLRTSIFEMAKLNIIGSMFTAEHL